MSNESLQSSPVLQPPGAGLPPLELRAARALFRWRQWRTSRSEVAVLFEEEKGKILQLAAREDAESGRQQVLIHRLRGLEDSSRFWSVFMTLDHLCIVNLGTTDTIARLARDESPTRVASTAAVKPSASADQTTIDRFVTVCNTFERTVDAIHDLRSRKTWDHPWFGPLNAAGWHFLTAFHMGLHRRQIEAIQRVKRG